MRQSLGTTVFAGMLGVTMFGLLFTPVFYVIVRGAAIRLDRFKKGRSPRGVESPGPEGTRPAEPSNAAELT
jgi:hypothetical protein